MASRSTQAELLEKITALTERVATLTEHVEHIERINAPVLRFTGWRGFPARPVNMASLADVLRYYAESFQLAIATYYLAFGSLYFLGGFSLLLGMSSVHLADSVRFIVGGVYTLNGIGNFSCIPIATVRHQQFIGIINTAIAVSTLVLSIVSNWGSIVALLDGLFWLVIIVIHVGFAVSIRGRIGLLQFTRQLRDASQAGTP